VANLPGLTGDSGTWRPQTANLSAYAGQSVLLAFRYITDSGVDEGGFWVRNISVGGTALPGDSLTGWQSATEVNPIAVQGFTVQLVAYGANGEPVWYHRLVDGGFTGSLSGSALQAAIGTSASTVAALVMYDDDSETAPKQARYTLKVNGVTQPGG
jgi:bacillopeptidase F (M6 metalloprotease family)